jgi:hypothetical protein
VEGYADQLVPEIESKVQKVRNSFLPPWEVKEEIRRDKDAES